MTTAVSYDYTAAVLKENAIACSSLWDEQVGVVSNYVESHDAFEVLPTGIERSLLFSCLTPSGV